MVCDVSLTNIDEHFQIFQWVPTQKAWLFHVSLLLGSYAGLISFPVQETKNTSDKVTRPRLGTADPLHK